MHAFVMGWFHIVIADTEKLLTVQIVIQILTENVQIILNE